MFDNTVLVVVSLLVNILGNNSELSNYVSP